MKLTLRSFDLRLKHTFTIAHGARDIQKTLIVELEKEGLKGYGEATATPYYGVTIEKLTQALKNVEHLLLEYQCEIPEQCWEKLQPLLNNNYFALSAVDCAFHDLHAKSKGQPLYQSWNLRLSDSLPITDYTIGIASVDKMIEKLIEKPWPLYKIKLGTRDDVAIIKELRRHTNSVFRVDANGAWEVDEAISNSKELKSLGVEFIEQPLPADDWEGMKKVYQQSSLPLVADESCQIEEDVDKCAGYFHGINIKLMKCGGLTPARRMIGKGRNFGFKIMVGCMTESSIGISAIAQLLPLIDYVDMDGALLLENDIADGVKIVDGRVYFPERNGIGAILKNEN